MFSTSVGEVGEVAFPMELNLRFCISEFGGDKLVRCPFGGCGNDETETLCCNDFDVFNTDPPGGPIVDNREGVDGRARSEDPFGAFKFGPTPPDRAP